MPSSACTPREFPLFSQVSSAHWGLNEGTSDNGDFLRVGTCPRKTQPVMIIMFERTVLLEGPDHVETHTNVHVSLTRVGLAWFVNCSRFLRPTPVSVWNIWGHTLTPDHHLCFILHYKQTGADGISSIPFFD